MRITFVHAPNIQYDQNYGTLFGPLWAYTLAAHVPASWEARIVDCMAEDPRLIEPSDVFAFSGINQDVDSIRRVHDDLKSRYPRATFILGGPITWSMEQEGKLSQLDYFDHLFILDGEETLPTFLAAFERDRARSVGKIIRADRFPLERCKPIRFDLYRRVAKNYYGALVEVSRGCPFLCEFCDIRVLPGNNRANNKDPELIVHEIDQYYKLGVTQFQLACDNFIGDIAWARRCVDAILAWKARTKAKISLFTWLTVNLYKMPDLMEKMRVAGFSILFIGIESVNHNSLLETAKVQNTNRLRDAVATIQSYGFIIAPGFIFGFDSDTETIYDDTLRFLEETGIIGGDPSFLTALPGTPLHRRMQRSGRLLEEQSATVRRKIQTNIRYLQDAETLTRGFLEFVERHNGAAFQLARFRAHVSHNVESKNFVPSGGAGYAVPLKYLRMQWRNPENRKMVFRRLAFLLSKPSRTLAVLKAWKLTRDTAKRGINLDVNFNYWVYVWTNIGLKYWGVDRTDFSIASVQGDFDFMGLLGAESALDADDNPAIGNEKAGTQARFTNRALLRLVEARVAGSHDAIPPATT